MSNLPLLIRNLNNPLEFFCNKLFLDSTKRGVVLLVYSIRYSFFLVRLPVIMRKSGDVGVGRSTVIQWV